MGHSIVFRTKIVCLSDGRVLHLSLSGCNNDTEGRKADDWTGKIYTKEDFIKYAESFKTDSKPFKDSEGFDLKIGNRYCTYYDYGMHLLRMLKRAISFDELTHSGKCVSFSKVDGVTVFGPEKTLKMSMKEFSAYYYDHINSGVKYRINYTVLETEEDIVTAFDSGESIRIYISKY